MFAKFKSSPEDSKTKKSEVKTQKCVIVDRTKLDPKNLKNSYYTGDIVTIKVPVSYLVSDEEWKSKPYDVPIPYYYNLLRRTKEREPLFEMLNDSKKLHWSVVDFYRKWIDKSMIMITEAPDSWNVVHLTRLNLKHHRFRNIKATFLNKSHVVHGFAIFYIPGMDIDKEWFVKNIFNNAFIHGTHTINYSSVIKHGMEIDTDKQRDTLVGILIKLDQGRTKFKKNLYSHPINDLIKMIKERHDHNVGKELDLLLTTEIIDKYKIESDVDVCRPTTKGIAVDQSWIELKKKYPGIIEEESDSVISTRPFYDLSLKSALIKHGIHSKEYKTIVDHNRHERIKVAKNFMNYLYHHHFSTLEDIYIIYNFQINHQYVNQGEPFYQGGPNFDTIREGESMIIELTYGVKAKNNDNITSTNYMYKYSSKIIHTDNFTIYNDSMRKQMESLGYEFRSPDEKIKHDKKRELYNRL